MIVTKGNKVLSVFGHFSITQEFNLKKLARIFKLQSVANRKQFFMVYTLMFKTLQ